MKYFAKVYVLSEEEAENIVQDVFAELWEKKDMISEYTNLVAYLFTSTKNRCFNYLRHQTIVQDSANLMQEEHRRSLQASLNSLQALDLQVFSNGEDMDEVFQKALNGLPEKCRQIFIMSKIQGKKQKEIAQELNISINTIETQMGLAYKHLRKELKHYLPLFIMIFLS